MRRVTRFIACTVALTSVACGPRRYSPVEVSSTDFDVSALTGRWSGEYHSEESGRSGNITFTLQPGEASAYGDVMMIPKTPTRSTVPIQNQTVGMPALGSVREILTIHFVRKEGNNVVGMLDPYQDPECYCRVITTFRGVFKNSGVIEGTYSTQGSDQIGMRAQGSWKVNRVKRL
ncbi:MAG TPA: hypothetical protein VJ840_17680 [Gemmatimonadaceae bacterium]|nr:hypothetical protein [Gemmatimonadaceae bacterium]